MEFDLPMMLAFCLNVFEHVATTMPALDIPVSLTETMQEMLLAETAGTPDAAADYLAATLPAAQDIPAEEVDEAIGFCRDFAESL